MTSEICLTPGIKESIIAQVKKKLPLPAELLELVETSLEDGKADSIVVIDLAGKTSLTDYMVIASGTSQRHVGGMASHLCETIKASGIKGVAVEGEPQCDWVLVDAGDVIIHLFRPEVREFYNLEKMWGVALPDVAADTKAATVTA
ncbi:MAG: ribosome silencing factor [Rhodospirillaceae bacterium]|nr:ribosome silencing factor [Rhodospirillaceae bacterium]